MKSKRNLLTVAAVLAAVVITACGSTGSSVTPQTSGRAQPSRAPAETAVAPVFDVAFKPTPETLSNLVWSPDGTKILVKNEKAEKKSDGVHLDYRISTWDLASASVANTFFINDIRGEWRTSLAAGTDGTVANVERDANVQIYNSKGDPARLVDPVLFNYGESGQGVMAFSPNNRSLLVLAGHMDTRREGSDGRPSIKRSYRVNVNVPGYETSYDSDNDIAPVMYISGIVVWDNVNNRSLLTLQDYNGQLAKSEVEDVDEFQDAVWSPDGKFIAAAGVRVVRVWNAANGQVVQNLKLSDGYSTHGIKIASGWGDGEEMRLPASAGGNIAYSADGKLLAVGGRGGMVTVFSMETNAEVCKIQAFGDGEPSKPEKRDANRAMPVAISPDNKQVTAISNDTLKVFDIASGREVKSISFAGKIPSFSPDGRFLAAITDNSVRVLNIASGKSARLIIYDNEAWAAAADEGISWIASETGKEFVSLRNGSNPDEGNDPARLLGVLSGK